MFNKKRIKRLEAKVDEAMDSSYRRANTAYHDTTEKETLFRAAIKKMYELCGYEVKISSIYSDFNELKEDDGWVLVDKTTTGAVHYRKKAEKK